jgi:Cu+-exporting ATPase
MGKRLIAILLGLCVMGLAVEAWACPCDKNKPAKTAKKAPKNAVKLVLAIEGMSCGGAASKISAALTKLDGVYTADVDFEKKQAEVKYLPKKVSKTKLVETVKKLGYKARLKKG